MISFREMTASDISAGLSLCRSAGWNQLDIDWKIFVSLSKYGNKVAVDDSGKVVGTVTTITYEDRFSWIGMVLVDPAMKRQGIGTQLLRQALDLLESQDTIKLDATPAGREVYLKLGFRDEYVLSRMMRQHGVQKPNGAVIKKEKISSVLKTDREIFGASRETLLKSYFSVYPELCYIKNPSVYCFGRRGFNFTQLGPVVADTVESAIEITSAALQNINGPVVIDAMENSAYSSWLQSIGFVEQRKLTRMYSGTNTFRGQPEKQFAILGPEFG